MSVNEMSSSRAALRISGDAFFNGDTRGVSLSAASENYCHHNRRRDAEAAGAGQPWQSRDKSFENRSGSSEGLPGAPRGAADDEREALVLRRHRARLARQAEAAVKAQAQP
jgi:hypothetical protein